MPALVSGREGCVWAAGFLTVALIIVATGFTSVDPDSALYAGMAERLSQEPVARWVAPEWWDFWPDAHMTGLFREHPSGVFWAPALLARLGVPAEQGAYVIGSLAGLLSLLLIGVVVNRVATRDDARAVVILLQLMPVAFIFRIRANHEYPMLLCLLVVILGLDGLKRTPAAWWLVAAGITMGLLVKGVFVSLVLLGASLWIAADPRRDGTSARRQWAGLAAAVAFAAVIAAIYDLVYLRATGQTFWLAYWERQLGPITIATPWQDAQAALARLSFYVSRLLWHPAPWSLVLVWVGVTRFSGVSGLPRHERRALGVALAFVVFALVILSLPSRFAERYAFSPTFVVATLGAIAARRAWPVLGDSLARLDRLVPALPAVLWTVLAIGRLTIGPYLPRI